MAALRGQVSYFIKSTARNTFLRSYSVGGTFKYNDLKVTLTDNPHPKPPNDKLVFGHHFSDHMLEVRWTLNGGWGTPEIVPVQAFQMHPAAKVLHYACELFEGMKAYRCVDNKIRLFRPMENMKRMLTTAERAALPAYDCHSVKFAKVTGPTEPNPERPLRYFTWKPMTFDGGELVKCMSKLISIDSEWVPDSTSCSLYVRPTLIGTDPTLGVTRSSEAILFVLTGPVGPYFPTGLKPVTLLADPQFVRAWPGSCGQYKMGSNYGPTIAIQDIALKEKNCQQVLWLYGDDHQLTEVGTMNLFMHWINEKGEKELITPPLDGLILPGITRMSLLELSRQWGEFKVTEGSFTMKQVVKGLQEGRVKEIFGAGTACVVCPVEKILYKDEMLEIPTMKDPELTNRFLKELNDIQWGRNPHDWMIDVDEADEQLQVGMKI